MTPNTQEIHLKVLRHLEDNPNITQRELAETLGISLGKTNYCMKALISKGRANGRKSLRRKLSAISSAKINRPKERALPGEVPDEVLANLMYAVMLSGIPTLMLALWFAYKISLSREQVEGIQASLRERESNT